MIYIDLKGQHLTPISTTNFSNYLSWCGAALRHENSAFRFHRQNWKEVLVPQKRMCFYLCRATKRTNLAENHFKISV